MMGIKSYTELQHVRGFEERFEYLALRGGVGHSTFGHDRWMNQNFYQSREWKKVRQFVIARDDNCDLGIPGYDIYGQSTIHHIVPMTPEDIEEGNPMILDPDNLITTTHDTHNAIHYGDKTLLRLPPVERAPGDTKLWQRDVNEARYVWVYSNETLRVISPRIDVPTNVPTILHIHIVKDSP